VNEQANVGVGRIRSWLVFGVVFRVLGRPVLLAAVALATAVGMPCAVLFASNGLRAVDVVALVHRSWAARVLLWSGWLALSVPALRIVFDAPGARSLRSFRLPRVPLRSALVLLALSVESPWGILFARGGGLGPAWAVLALGICAAGFAHAAAAQRRFALAFAVTLAVLAAFPPSWVLGVAGTLVMPYALGRAWALVPEQRSFRLRAIRPTYAFLALYLAHALRLARSARGRLMVALTAGTTGALGLVFSLQNDPTARPVARALSALCLPLTLAAAVCVSPVTESEACLRVHLRALRTPRAFVVGAFVCAVATPSSVLAATTGMAAGGPAHVQRGLLVLALLGWGSALSAAVALWGRVLEARARRSAGMFAAGVTLIAALGFVGANLW